MTESAAAPALPHHRETAVPASLRGCPSGSDHVASNSGQDPRLSSREHSIGGLLNVPGLHQHGKAAKAVSLTSCNSKSSDQMCPVSLRRRLPDFCLRIEPVTHFA